MSTVGDTRFRPLSDWFEGPTPPDAGGDRPSTDVGAPPATQERVLVRLVGDPRRASVLLAAVVRVFDAHRGAEVLLAVQGVLDPRSSDAQAIEDLVPELAEDPAELPDMELVGDDPHLDDEVDLVVTATGTPWGDAQTVLELGALWRS